MKTSPASFRKWIAPLGLAIVLIGTGCRTTQRVVQLSRPHQEAVPHTVERLDAAYVTPEGRLHVRAQGRLAGDTQLRELTIQVAKPMPERAQLAERIVVAADSVRAGWTPPGEGARTIAVGAPLVFRGNDSYNWDRLQAAEGETEQVHLIRRANSAVSWEILHVNAQSKVAFRIYEMQPASVTVKRPTYALLVPFAAATDVLNGTAATVAPTVATGVLWGAATGWSAIGAVAPFSPYYAPYAFSEGLAPERVFSGASPLPMLCEQRDGLNKMFDPLRETLRSTSPELGRSK